MNETLLREFCGDAEVADRLLGQGDAEYLERCEAFVRAAGALGIERRAIFVEDFAVFGSAKLAELIESFIRDCPRDELPLASVTVVQYAGAASCEADLADTRRRLDANEERMRRFATHYNIEVTLQVFVRGLAAGPAIAIAEFARSPAVDELGFYFDLAGAEPDGMDGLRAELAQLAGHAACRNPKVRFGSFPFCLFPEEALKVQYRDAVDGIKGRIGDQRVLVEEIARETPEDAFHAPCRECRCRRACYAYTEVGAHPAFAPALRARRGSTAVFAGGSLSAADVPDDADLVWIGPAEQGDMVAAVLEGFDHILLMDGYFYSRFPCTTFEVLLALEHGVKVFGASSIGALRAVELDAWGMIGVGRVYAYLKDKTIKPYHVVAQVYDENDRALSEPLIRIIVFLAQAAAEGVIDPETHEALRAAAEEIHFTALSFDAFFDRARAAEGVPAGTVERLSAWFAAQGSDRFDIKRQDARLLLNTFRRELADRGEGYVADALRVANRRNLGALTAKYPPDQRFALPADWRAREPAAQAASATRDSRVRGAAETCGNARRFLDGLDVVLADTTRFDAADSYILSTFFVPFYFLDYYPSSATGNGDVFEEALASAYMELVERIPASALQVRGRAANDLAAAPFPEDRLPQRYNWGGGAAARERAVGEHGYVKVTDLLAGEDVYVPGYSLMFRYSGTDGYAAGNSAAEAILYGLYETIERDTCRLYHYDAACRKLLPRLVLDRRQVRDPRCAKLLRQADEKGCDVVLFTLPNLYGLPCVMCHVYDRNRRIQCHGGIAVRSSLDAAAYAAVHEAYMQYITYFVGTRDDYRAFAPLKQARIAFQSARGLYPRDLDACRGPVPESAAFSTVGDELDHVLRRLTEEGVRNVLVADLSPRPEFRVTSVKVIVPTLELWFCPDYVPSRFFPGRAARTAEAARVLL